MHLCYRNVYIYDLGQVLWCGVLSRSRQQAAASRMADTGQPRFIGLETVALSPSGRITIVFFEPHRPLTSKPRKAR